MEVILYVEKCQQISMRPERLFSIAAHVESSSS